MLLQIWHTFKSILEMVCIGIWITYFGNFQMFTCVDNLSQNFAHLDLDTGHKY